MTRPERAQVILEAVDKTFPIPGFMQTDVKEAIVKAQVMAEKERYAPRYQALFVFIEIDKIYSLPAHKTSWIIEIISGVIKELEARNEEEN